MGSGNPALLVAQSGGPTAAINASLAGVVETALDATGVGRILGARFGIEGILTGDLIDLRETDRRLWSRIRRTPSAALGSCRRKLGSEERDRALRALRDLDVRYFLYIGGNDSADTALHLSTEAAAQGYDLRVIAVPKTIDNDLPGTDHCPGYGSAARYIAQSTQDAGLDTEAMCLSDPIKVIEVMGRDAGWLAAAAVLGRRRETDAPHLVCVPERAIDTGAFVAAMEAAYKRFGYAVAVVAETVRDQQERPIGSANEVRNADAFGHPTIAGAGATLAGLVGRSLGVKARYDKPGTLQRMSIALASPVDLDEAYAAGSQAVRWALEGRSACMVGFQRQSGRDYSITMHPVDLRLVANQVRRMPPEMLGDDPFGIADAFVHYATPLIGPPLLEYARLSP